EHLRAIMRSCLRPGRCFTGSFDGITDVFAIAERRFSQQSPVVGADFHAVAGIRPHLLAADVEFHCPINCWDRCNGLRSLLGFRFVNTRQLWSVLKPCRLQIFAQTFASALASVSTLAVTAESAGRVE